MLPSSQSLPFTLVLTLALAGAPATLVAQEGEREPGFVLDGQELDGARATLDPHGTLQLVGDLPGGDSVRFLLTFPRLEFPPAGAHAVGGEGADLHLEQVTPRAAKLVGEIELAAFGPDRVSGSFVTRDDENTPTTRFRFELAPRLAPLQAPEVTDQPAASIVLPDPLRPAAVEDLVLFAIGGGGTGLPGASLVADGMRKLAAEMPLDLVLVASDAIQPIGPTAIGDPRWAERFDAVYGGAALTVPFHGVVGPATYRGDAKSAIDIATMNQRWVLDSNTYGGVFRAGDLRVAIISVDTVKLVGDIADPACRIANRNAVQEIDKYRDTDWQIVVGHHPMRSGSVDLDPEHAAMLRDRLGTWLHRRGVDVYVAGGVPSIELIEDSGMLHVNSGGAGGPEMARSVAYVDGTVYADTGGGFVALRFLPDGQLEVSCHDGGGALRFLHQRRARGPQPDEGR